MLAQVVSNGDKWENLDKKEAPLSQLLGSDCITIVTTILKLSAINGQGLLNPI